jgi:hypothetical protein
MLGKFIAEDFIAIAGEMRRFPASNENTALHSRFIYSYIRVSKFQKLLCQEVQ